MALATNNSVYIHIPKTAGLWIRHAMAVCGLSAIELGEQHDHFPGLLQFRPETFFHERLVWTMVRHPVTWYQSRWAFRVKYGWQSRHPLDWNAASNNFCQFVENALRFKPDGWCTWEFNQYINNWPGIVKFVGRTENLLEDFLTVMHKANEPINEKIIRSIPPVNASTMDGQNSSKLALYTPELLRRVLAVENEIIQMYYHNYQLNLDDYVSTK